MVDSEQCSSGETSITLWFKSKKSFTLLGLIDFMISNSWGRVTQVKHLQLAWRLAPSDVTSAEQYVQNLTYFKSFIILLIWVFIIFYF